MNGIKLMETLFEWSPLTKSTKSNDGLVYGNPEKDIKKLAVCCIATIDVINEAVESLGRESADTIEKILECDREAKKFVLSALTNKIDSVVKNIGNKDHKTKLQEILQMRSNGKICYEIIKEEGPEHSKQYTSVVKFNDKVLGKGIGKNKKEAEQNAAGAALESIELNKIKI